MIIFLGTSFQILDQILQFNFIYLCDIFESTEPLQQTAHAIGIPPSKYPKGLRPSLQNIFNGELCVEILCVHCPKDTTIRKFPLCAGANSEQQKRHAGSRALGAFV